MKNHHTLSNNSRACVFIDSSNPNLPNQVMRMSSKPFIKVAFPPVINIRDLMTKQNENRRGPNAFIIYRKVFVETARADGYQLPMTVVSSMASQSWEQESDAVKAEYKKLAKEANEIRNEIYPKSPRHKKRERWNIVSFQPSSSKTDSRKRSSRSSSKQEQSRNEPGVQTTTSTVTKTSQTTTSTEATRTTEATNEPQYDSPINLYEFINSTPNSPVNTESNGRILNNFIYHQAPLLSSNTDIDESYLTTIWQDYVLSSPEIMGMGNSIYSGFLSDSEEPISPIPHRFPSDVLEISYSNNNNSDNTDSNNNSNNDHNDHNNNNNFHF